MATKEVEYTNDDPRMPVYDGCAFEGCEELAEPGDIFCKGCQDDLRIESVPPMDTIDNWSSEILGELT